MRIPSNPLIISRLQIWLVKNLDWEKRKLAISEEDWLPGLRPVLCGGPLVRMVIRCSDL